MVRVNLKNTEDVGEAFDELTGKGIKLEGVLVQEMVKGHREFVIGLTRDPHFGPCVMFGLGGIFTEAMKDVSFRVAPLTEEDAREMIGEIARQNFWMPSGVKKPLTAKYWFALWWE